MQVAIRDGSTVDCASDRSEDPPVRSILSHTVMIVDTTRATEFVDITVPLSQAVRETGLTEGLLVIHTRHTTTGLLINEREPLLMRDLEVLFESVAPRDASYAHDDFRQRTVNLVPEERQNGHAHCRAALLRTSETISVLDGRLNLGRWQRVFLVEFDGAQRREVAIMMTGRAVGKSGAQDPRTS
jgi:secondary thiamine-phosphate synthase enzyme